MSVYADILGTKEARAEPVGGCAIDGQPERIDRVCAEQVGVTKSVRRSQVVPAANGTRQYILRQGVGIRNLECRKHIAAENRMLCIDLIIEFVDNLVLVYLLDGSPIDCSARIRCCGKVGG